MRIALSTVQVPFTTGGAEVHVTNLKRALEACGHEVDTVSFPFKWYPPPELVKQMLIARLFDLSESNGKPIDRLIGMKFPAYYIKHPYKVLWILHQHRQAYNLWGTEYCDLMHSSQGERVRKLIWQADNRFLREARMVFANSQEVARRLQRFNNITATPLYHPPGDLTGFYCQEYGDYIFYPSRIEPIKRQLLLVEAMAEVQSPVRCVLAGSNSWPQVAEYVHRRNLDHRVTLLGYISHTDKLRLYASSLAVFYGPFDEDYGYVTLEAMLSRKSVITCTDSGGPREFVEHGRTGFVVEPDPYAIAQVLDQLYAEKERARSLGEAGYELYQSKDISWERVVEALLSV